MLNNAQRKFYFNALGLGEYNRNNILKLQKRYFVRSMDKDGIYGTNTDRLLRSLYNVTMNSKNFKLSEFQCGCGGRYCTGYPAVVNSQLVRNLQTLRNEGGPITITSGLRCSRYNARLSGSISRSKHTQGKAADIYCRNLTATRGKRNALIRRWYRLPNATYAYGNTAGMGNAVHVDVK